MSTLDDEQLIQKVAGGDASAYRELVLRHGARLHHFALRVTGSAAEAEDVVQETFLRLWQRARDYSPRARVTTWLHRIALNLCIDRLRATKSHPASERALEDQPSSASPLQPGLLEEKRRAVLLEQAIRKLPERQATAITLVHLQGFTGEEAAQVMGTSQEALESLLARARRSLKASLLLAGVEARRGGE